MAKSRRRRVTSVNANRRLPFSSFTPRVSPSILTQYEDRRQWHPEGEYAPARSFSQSRHRLVAPRSKSKIQGRHRSLRALQRLSFGMGEVPSVVAFQAPRRVLICVRRSIRKSVLHALKKTGKVGQKRPRRSFYSSISCRG